MVLHIVYIKQKAYNVKKMFNSVSNSMSLSKVGLKFFNKDYLSNIINFIPTSNKTVISENFYSYISNIDKVKDSITDLINIYKNSGFRDFNFLNSIITNYNQLASVIKRLQEGVNFNFNINPKDIELIENIKDEYG